MKSQTEQIVTTLQELTKDEFYSLVGDAPYIVIPWEVDDKGPFSVERFLVDNTGLMPFTPEEFLSQIRATQSQAMSDHYQNLIALLQANLSELSIYGYRLPTLPEELQDEFPLQQSIFGSLGIPMVIGSSTPGEWIGLGIKQTWRCNSSPQFMIPDIESVQYNTAALVEQIQSITNQINHKAQAEEELSFGGFEVVITTSRHEVMQKLLDTTGFLEISEINEFIRVRDDYGNEIEEYQETIAQLEQELVKLEEEGELSTEEYQEVQEELSEERSGLEEIQIECKFEIDLRNLFATQLLNSKTYHLNFNLSGEWCTVHYALGETHDQDWVVVATSSYTL